MRFQTLGDKNNPTILFFHAMGVTGASSERVAAHLRDRFFCVMPTSTVYCEGQAYVSKQDEIEQVESYLAGAGVDHVELVVASSLGADLATAFLAATDLPVGHVFFDGGQFAQIAAVARRAMTPLLWLAIKSLWWSRGRTLKHIMWCDDEAIRPYFIEAGRALTYANLRRQLSESLVDEPFPALPEGLQRRAFWEFGSAEDHFKYRDAVMSRYPSGNFPIFEGFDHMQYQIQDPEGFAHMLESVIQENRLPELPFLR